MRSSGFRASHSLGSSSRPKQLAEVHTPGKVRFHNQIGAVPEAVAIGFLQTESVWVGCLRSPTLRSTGAQFERIMVPVAGGVACWCND